jgi:NitT/TauT family transport system substrate-binding protein
MTLAGTAGLIGLRPGRADAEPPPETTTLRLFESPYPSCVAPMYVAEELLYSEGFTSVRYVKFPTEIEAWPPEALLSGQVDIGLSFGPKDVLAIEAGAPIVILAGSHIGCVELFGSNRVKSTRELKGKNVARYKGIGDDHVFISMFVAHVGLDPQKDINWVLMPPDSWEAMRLLAEGKIDAYFVGPPDSLEMRAKKIGHILVNTTTDKPWSHYFCCMVASSKEFVRKNPVATKRALRAILKAADVCALEPERVVRSMLDKGRSPRYYDSALQSLKEIPYSKWREFDAEDSMRFYALRMHDIGLIKSSPQKIIAQGTDFRFLNELKNELKG